MSERAQIIIIWWGYTWMVLFGFALYWLLKMMPPPDATLTATEVAAFYLQNSFEIKLGATIASWLSAFAVPINVVAAIQLSRLEKGTVPAWSILAFAGGILMTMFLVFPPICWGVAAYTAERAPEITALMHELGTLTLVTTDQYFIFQMVPIAIVSLSQKHDELSAFPRWLGYMTLWIAIAFEVGALAFMFKSGPFSWNGLFVFWIPLTTFGFWNTAMCIQFTRALRRQAAQLQGQAPAPL